MWTVFDHIVLSIAHDVAKGGFGDMVQDANHYWQTNAGFL